MRLFAVSGITAILFAAGVGPASALILLTNAQKDISFIDFAFSVREKLSADEMRASISGRNTAAESMYALEQSNKKKIGDQKNNDGLTATTAPQIDAGSKDPAKMNVNPKYKVR
jgi:hypothetical protein